MKHLHLPKMLWKVLPENCCFAPPTIGGPHLARENNCIQSYINNSILYHYTMASIIIYGLLSKRPIVNHSTQLSPWPTHHWPHHHHYVILIPLSTIIYSYILLQE